MILLNVFFYLKQNDSPNFKDTLNTFCYDTLEIKPNNEAQEKN